MIVFAIQPLPEVLSDTTTPQHHNNTGGVLTAHLNQPRRDKALAAKSAVNDFLLQTTVNAGPELIQPLPEDGPLVPGSLTGLHLTAIHPNFMPEAKVYPESPFQPYPARKFARDFPGCPTISSLSPF